METRLIAGATPQSKKGLLLTEGFAAPSRVRAVGSVSNRRIGRLGLACRLLAATSVVVLAGCSSLKPNNNPNFGTLYVGQSATANVTWGNTRTAKTVTGYYIDPNPPFSRTPPGPISAFNVAIGANTAPPLTIDFAPRAAGNFNGDVTPLVDTGQSSSARLTGAAVWQKLVGTGLGVTGGNYVANQVLDFGIVNLGAPAGQRTVTRTFNLFSTSTNPIALRGTFVAPPGAGPFSITAPPNPINFTAAAVTRPVEKRVTLTFAPTAVGNFEAIVEFRSATTNHLFGIVCRGSAVRRTAGSTGGGTGSAGGSGSGD